METMNNFVFPNELHITWTVMIVLYPYITGMVAGAFGKRLAKLHDPIPKQYWQLRTKIAPS